MVGTTPTRERPGSLVPTQTRQAMLTGTVLIRPDQSNVVTTPNIFEEGETYIGCKLDWSDLEEKVEYVLDNFKELNLTQKNL